MAIQFVNKWFSKRGKGVPQVELKDENGVALMEDGKPVIGNEQFEVKQLTSDSISGDSADAFLTDVLETSTGDLKLAAVYYRIGYNEHVKSLAGGSDEATKAARVLFKMGVTFGCSDPVELASAIREGKIKVG